MYYCDLIYSTFWKRQICGKDPVPVIDRDLRKGDKEIARLQRGVQM
jgi:hypothetical protein